MAEEKLEVKNAHKLSESEFKARRMAALVSLLVGISLLIFKFWVHNFTRSQAVFSDAMESIVNVVAASLALFVIRFSNKPADQEHPYGHGKVEYFSAAFEGGLITFAAIFIIVEAIQSFLRETQLQQLSVGVGMVLAAGVVNLLLGLYLVRVGKKNRSQALQASGWHVMSDFWTSFGVSLGLVLVLFTGLTWIDPAVAIIVGVWLGWTGIRLVRESIASLMDEEDLSSLESLAKVFNNHKGNGVIQIHQVKTIRSAWFHHIDAHIVLPEFWSVLQMHSRMLDFEKKVIQDYPYSGEMNFHADPCRRAYCRVCDLKDCPVREEDFKEKLVIQIEDLRSQHEPQKFRGSK